MVRLWNNRMLFSLTGYVIAGVIIAHLILTPLLYQTILNTYKHNTHEQFISHIREVTGLLGDVLITNHQQQDYEGIVDVLNSAILGGKILYIDVITSDGHIISPSDSMSINPESFTEDQMVNQHGDDIYYLAIPLHFKDIHNNPGRLRIGFDESAVTEEYQSLKETTIYLLITYFSAVILLMAAITHYIHKPLRILQNRSKEIASGDTDIPLQLTSKISDIQFLADDLETMRSALVSLAEHMHDKATHDDLTGLPNRYLYTDHLEMAIALASRENRSFAVLLLDLNRFKEINDTLGHGIGDEVLKITAGRMQSGMRDSDTLARIGGDEFCIILNGVGQILAETIANKIIRLIEPIMDVKGHSLKIGASVGISIFPDDGDNSEILMQRADVAMYNAKHNNLHVASYHNDMDSDNIEKLMMASDLKSNISLGFFEGLFQPKIDIQTGRACGCELLLRWQHPQLGIILPEKFIPLAERENLIGELTRWVIGHYLIQMLPIIEKYRDFHLSINVSPIDLIDTKLLTAINEIIEKTGFPAKNLYIEVTENAIMKNPARSASVLNEFNGAGIQISIDDFGTGYSSLAYLQKFPITELKIDKSFITYLTEKSNNFPIVNATITMAHDLGITVVAEGVESKEVLDLLVQIGCDQVQGYYFSKPVDINQLINWLDQHSENVLEQN